MYTFSGHAHDGKVRLENWALRPSFSRIGQQMVPVIFPWAIERFEKKNEI